MVSIQGTFTWYLKIKKATPGLRNAEDINTQQSFEQLNPRAVGVVVDPIQSVKGKVVIDCFRCLV